MVSRKQIKMSKGLKAAVRTWKDYYAVLEGHLMLFYKEKAVYFAFPDNTIISENIHNAVVTMPANYTKRNNVIHIKLEHGAEFYLQLESPKDMYLWLNNIQQASKLPIDETDRFIAKDASKQSENVPSTTINVAAIIDIDESEILSPHKSSSSSAHGLNLDATPSSPLDDDAVFHKPNEQRSAKSKHDKRPTPIQRRPASIENNKSKSVNRQLSCEYSHSFGSRSPTPSPLIYKSPPVSLELIKNRQLILDEKAKSQTLGPDGQHSGKSKKIVIRKLFSKGKSKGDEDDKWDEV